MITGNMSPFARELNGFSGIKFSTVSVMVVFVVTLACARPTMFNPAPGLIMLAIKRATVTATAVVIRYMSIVRPPIAPIFLISEMEATPTTIEKKTSGTTNIFINLMNPVPPR